MKIVAIVQARIESERFPSKICSSINGMSALEFLLNRLSRSNLVDQIVVAFPDSEKNDDIAAEIASKGFTCFRGNQQDVLDRYYRAANKHKAGVIVRVTADCPLLDPQVVDEVVLNLLNHQNVKISVNTSPPSFPDGLDCSAFYFEYLEEAAKMAKSSFDREHVEPYILRKYSNDLVNLKNKIDLSNLRLTIDEPVDLNVINRVISYFQSEEEITVQSIEKLAMSHPEIFEENMHLIRNEGSIMNTGQKLYRRAKQIIPGATMLFSKRSENFLPEIWPAYFSKAKDCRVWDLDGKMYLDMSLMGIGSNVLGYADPYVDDAVMSAITKGNMSTLNAPEEVYLAERLLELHKWGEMVRFARTGGEINAVAIRISRAFTGKDGVAICGYHGWHDWYLASNLNSEGNLDQHLMQGLETNGVPKVLAGTAIPFQYNDIENFESAIKDKSVGTVIMEVSRNFPPNDGYLEYIRKRTRELGLVLIFDECSSGFRETFGGLHLKYNVQPDLLTLGKAMGNGYAITALVGTKDIMKHFESSFISSTFWSERIGSTAALATLEVFEKNMVWEALPRIGASIKSKWQEIGSISGTSISISGIDAMPRFNFISDSRNITRTYFTQEMLKRGYLASTGVNVSTVHSDKILVNYYENMLEVFNQISSLGSLDEILSKLETEPAHSDFRRLN